MDKHIKKSKAVMSFASAQLQNIAANLKRISRKLAKNEEDMQTKLTELYNDCRITIVTLGKRRETFKNSILAAFDAYLQVFMSQVYSPILVLSGQIHQRQESNIIQDGNFKRRMALAIETVNSSLTLALEGARVQCYRQFADTEKKADVNLQKILKLLIGSEKLRKQIESIVPEVVTSLDRLQKEISVGGKHVLTLTDSLVSKVRRIHNELSDVRVDYFKTEEKGFENQERALLIACRTELRAVYDEGFLQFQSPLKQLVEAMLSLSSDLDLQYSEFVLGKITFSELISAGQFDRKHKVIENAGLFAEAGLRDTVNAMKTTSTFIEKLLSQLFDLVPIDTFTKKFAYVLGLRWMNTRRAYFDLAGGVLGKIYNYNGTTVMKLLHDFAIYNGGFVDDKSARYWEDIIANATGDLTDDLKGNISNALNATKIVLDYFNGFLRRTHIDQEFYK